MKKNFSGETMVSIIIFVMLIGIVFFGITKIIEYDNSLNFEQDKIHYISLIERNTMNLVKKIDTDSLKENDIFYIFKTGSTIQVFTGSVSGSINEQYKYIDHLGNYVLIDSYKGTIYARQCFVEKDSDEGKMIKCGIKELIRK